MLSALLVALTVAAADIPRLDWQPRSDWLDVKTRYAAAGDGVADDTAALQAALTAAGDGATLYLPAGTYRLTQTLTLNGPHLGITLIGCGRATTLVWDGEGGGRMFRCNGVAESRFIGLTWDGRGKAAVGFDHNSANRFETEVRHQYEAFRDFTVAGIRIGWQQKLASAEITYLGCLFERCATGVSIGTFNDYDNSFDGCEWRDCGTGIADNKGNFYVRNSHFARSKIVDCRVGSEHGSSIRRCTSSGSKRFVSHAGISPLVLQDCHVAHWTDPEAAVDLLGSPVMMLDCAFDDGPPGQAPVRLGGSRKLIARGNRPADAAALVGAAAAKIPLLLPAGEPGGVVRDAEQTFLRSDVDVTYRVLDAKRDFGAKGDGRSDDTDALQHAIDAARAAGHGTLAYLPTGNYVISRSLRITGADYRFGGSGYNTRILWRGPEHGIGIEVVDPQNVALEQFMLGHHDSGPMKLDADIRQSSTGGPSRVTYDTVDVFGMYQKKPDREGLLFDHLPAGSLVHVLAANGNLRFDDCGAARFLLAQSFEGTVTVSGKGKQRDGLIGFEFRLETLVEPSVQVRDNQSLVMSDFYLEQAQRHLVLEGGADDPPGRVTITGPKIHTETQYPLLEAHGYHGQVYLGDDQYYVAPKEPRFVTTGELPLLLTLAGNFWYNVTPRFELAPSTTLVLVANAGPADQGVEHLEGLVAATDDLRRLGGLDAEVNGR